jgi:hypothetical protein
VLLQNIVVILWQKINMAEPERFRKKKMVPSVWMVSGAVVGVCMRVAEGEGEDVIYLPR